ncbi:MAG: response regulator transcription factor [Dysgonamonadaceae bacterium]|jgi:DNA-binding NarL/FixJ family response regulator|nr:response regulator transcription factor [Dysgonamonadaceae bacterium]
METHNWIDILLVDDSLIHREGLKIILRKNENFHISGEAVNPAAALDCIKQQIPDIVLLDISLESETDGIELARFIRKNYPSVKILFLSHYKSVSYLSKALQTGACAYLPKDTKPDELIHAILSAREGKGRYLGETLPLATLLDVFNAETTSANTHHLTPREIKIIELLAQGYSSKEIAVILNIGNNTVESHKERIKEKLQVKTVVQIVVVALKAGIINLD